MTMARVYAVECPVCPICKETYVSLMQLYRNDPNFHVYHLPYTATRYYITRKRSDLYAGKVSSHLFASYAERDRYPTWYFGPLRINYISSPRYRIGLSTIHPAAFRHFMKLHKPELYVDSPIDRDILRAYENYLSTVLREKLAGLA